MTSPAATLCLVLLGASASFACSRQGRKPGRAAPVDCFAVQAAKNSKSTQAVFGARRCQGGGVTWAAILDVVVRRRGPVEPVVEPTPGWTGSVSTLNGRTRFAIDDEGDQAQFCADDPELLSAVRDEYRRLNGDANELRRAMGEASALSLECLEADGGVPAVPALAPPALPENVRAEVRAQLERLQRTVLQEPSWCFPLDDIQGHTGALRLLPDGTAIHVPGPGKPSTQGRWTLPPAGSGDTRLQVLAGILVHLDVGKSGRLGFNYTNAKGVDVREDLIPGDACLKE